MIDDTAGQSGETWQERLNSTTQSLPEEAANWGRQGVPTLTILAHPDIRRIGEEAPLLGLMDHKEDEVSRLAPCFAPPEGGAGRPLADVHLSRRPLRITSSTSGWSLDAGELSAPVEVNGQCVQGRWEIPPQDLRRGVVLLLAERVTLLLHDAPLPVRRPASFGLVGDGPSMLALRTEIERLTDLDFPVLVRGASGTGKELVARALHDAGGRGGPYVSVNMGALSPNLAVSELFGSVKGAFTGADRSRTGFFQQAHGGTLFLDEIGEAPAEVQVLLLRALETGEIRPVGSAKALPVDVRLISATDRNLEASLDDGSFREPLYHRLATCEVRLPPLEDRREDLGRLIRHFLGQELATIGEPWRLAPSRGEPPWLPANLIARLALFHWPGNVRQLRNVVRQVVVASRGESVLRLPSQVERLLKNRLDEAPTNEIPHGTEESPGDAAAPSSEFRDADDISDEEIEQALRRSRWHRTQTAIDLGISRPALYRRLERMTWIPKAADLDDDEIREAQARCGGRLDDMVDLLRVSKRALKLRMSKMAPRSGEEQPDDDEAEPGMGAGRR